MKFIRVTSSETIQLLNPAHIVMVRTMHEKDREPQYGQSRDNHSNSVIELAGWTIRVKETLDEIEEKIAAAAT